MIKINKYMYFNSYIYPTIWISCFDENGRDKFILGNV